MLFIDDEAQHNFHKSPALLQIVCSMLESSLAKHFYQCEIVDTQANAGASLAMVIICPIDCEIDPVDEALVDDVLIELNARFKRKDHAPTIRVETEDYNIIHVRVTTAQDFAQLT